MPFACLIMRYIALCALMSSYTQAYANDKIDTPMSPPNNFGNLLFSAKLNLEQQFTTNLLAASQDEKNDFITTITPSLSIKKDIRDHELTLKANAPITKHLRTHNEDTVNGHISLSSLITAKRSLKIPLSVSYSKSHIKRHEDTSTITPSKPIQIRRRHIEGGFIFAPNRLHIGLIGHYTNNRFSNNNTETKLPLIYKDNDHNNTGLSSKISYNSGNKLSPFLAFKTHKARFLRRTYSGTSFNGAKRDHVYHSILAGINLKSKMLSGEISAGYNTLEYDNTSSNNLYALQIAANLNWEPTELSNLNLSLVRNAAEDSIIKSSYTENTINANLKYQAQNNLSVNTSTTFSHHNYTSGRDDMIYEGQIGANYTLNTAMQAHAKITTRKRDSNENNEDYLQNTLMVGITGNL